jgi:NTP pyrophosphatase (non-canonical NTP hydrolase)
MDFTDSMSYYPGGLTYVGLGIAGEAGEVADDIKKMIRDDNNVLTPERRHRLLLETGDVLFYITRLCRHLGVTHADVMELNRTKLLDRRKRLIAEGVTGHIG